MVEFFLRRWRTLFNRERVSLRKIDEHYFLEQQVNVGLGFEFCSIFDLNSTSIISFPYQCDGDQIKN
jgi:hypothetical protein